MLRTTINDLPADVLLAIFRVPLLSLRNIRFWHRSPPGWDDNKLGEWLDHEYWMPRLAFPESIASVCCCWREVMSSVSAFWTRLVIWVGKNPTSLSLIREYIQLSRGHPIAIYILQKSGYSDTVAAKAEVDSQLKVVMETLAPHMARRSVLQIDMHNASSLPRPHIELVGTQRSWSHYNSHSTSMTLPETFHP